MEETPGRKFRPLDGMTLNPKPLNPKLQTLYFGIPGGSTLGFQMALSDCTSRTVFEPRRLFCRVCAGPHKESEREKEEIGVKVQVEPSHTPLAFRQSLWVSLQATASSLHFSVDGPSSRQPKSPSSSRHPKVTVNPGALSPKPYKP